MKKARITVGISDEAAIEAAAAGFVAAWNDAPEREDVLSFATPAQLFTVLTPKRWMLIEQLQKSGPVSYRRLAELLGRDVKRVHEDAAALMEWGLVARHDHGGIHVPYDVIRADFDLKAVA